MYMLISLNLNLLSKLHDCGLGLRNPHPASDHQAFISFFRLGDPELILDLPLLLGGVSMIDHLSPFKKRFKLYNSCNNWRLDGAIPMHWFYIIVYTSHFMCQAMLWGRQAIQHFAPRVSPCAVTDLAEPLFGTLSRQSLVKL